MLQKPDLVQRCELRDGKLKYDYMGSTEFEIGDQANALKTIFASEMTTGSAKVAIEDKEVEAFMVAGAGFPFADYQPYLQKLADGKLRTKERTDFDDAVKAQVGLPTFMSRVPSTDAWFDFPNGVLWTLTEENRHKLIAALERIKGIWASKIVQIPKH